MPQVVQAYVAIVVFSNMNTVEQAQSAASFHVEEADQITGSWLASGFMGGRVTIYRKNSKVWLYWRYKDGSGKPVEVVRKKTSNGARFDETTDSSHGEYYLINSSGELEVRDTTGVILTAKPG